MKRPHTAPPSSEPRAPVHIVQYLCPSRHCIASALYVEGQETSEGIIAKFRAGLTAANITAKCGICLSTDLTFEDKATPFRSMEEAYAAVADVEAQQIALAQITAAAGYVETVQEMQKRARQWISENPGKSPKVQFNIRPGDVAICTISVGLTRGYVAVDAAGAAFVQFITEPFQEGMTEATVMQLQVTIESLK